MKKIFLGSLITLVFLAGCGAGSSPVDKSQKDNPKIDNSQKDILEEKNVLEDNKLDMTKSDGESINTNAPAIDVAVSKETLFVAQGENGVEIIKIGYDDVISSARIAQITDINAYSVSVSQDGSLLYVTNEDGFVNIIDITNINKPQKVKLLNKKEADIFTLSQSGRYKFVPKNKKGLEIFDVSNPSNPTLETTITNFSAYSAVVAQNDTKVLVASGMAGINIVDISDIKNPNTIARYKLKGNTTGLALDEEAGILFVANGDNGVSIFNVDMVIAGIYR